MQGSGGLWIWMPRKNAGARVFEKLGAGGIWGTRYLAWPVGEKPPASSGLGQPIRDSIPTAFSQNWNFQPGRQFQNWTKIGFPTRAPVPKLDENWLLQRR